MTDYANPNINLQYETKAGDGSGVGGGFTG